MGLLNIDDKMVDEENKTALYGLSVYQWRQGERNLRLRDDKIIHTETEDVRQRPLLLTSNYIYVSSLVKSLGPSM